MVDTTWVDITGKITKPQVYPQLSFRGDQFSKIFFILYHLKDTDMTYSVPDYRISRRSSCLGLRQIGAPSKD